MSDQNAFQVGQLSSNPTSGHWDMAGGAKFVYEFTVGENSNMNLSITDVVGDVQLDLYKDNGDGKFNASDTFRDESDRPGNRDEAINRFDGAGRYFAVVYNNSLTTDAHYNFTLSATTHNSVLASNLLPTEFNLGTVDKTHPAIQTLFLGDGNNADTFAFHLDKTSNIHLLLQQGGTILGAQGDSDVRIGQDTNHDRIIQDTEIIGFSNNLGNADDKIDQSLIAGDYFVQVYQFKGNIHPTLQLSVS
ncbi:hypothetical protein NIES4075_35680 [Tolypothrix sp. NIES-4075]|uniref:pre-peptidase C-terminal domain-containing protein n=1 Tax=Tolypothrix sp. NIES-4075 TaxID=2005459 RepID=UPI000B5C9FD6|nr:pre-peptidase C-terminal domain-containing protein [Tolypothrix sp. NIES-4075]GAX42566.1 hypothetical protein NIES4075_35680 [Tolypothrix sp. NIES-4075]